jgi:hypothetical protein
MQNPYIDAAKGASAAHEIHQIWKKVASLPGTQGLLLD